MPGRAATRRERCVAVRDLADVADAGHIELRKQWHEEALPRLAPRRGRVAAHPHPRLDEWAHEPRPDGALVVSRVTRCPSPS